MLCDLFKQIRCIWLFPLVYRRHIKRKKRDIFFLPVLHPEGAEFSLWPSARLSQPTELARQLQTCKPKHTHTASCQRGNSAAEKTEWDILFSQPTLLKYDIKECVCRSQTFGTIEVFGHRRRDKKMCLFYTFIGFQAWWRRLDGGPVSQYAEISAELWNLQNETGCSHC